MTSIRLNSAIVEPLVQFAQKCRLLKYQRSTVSIVKLQTKPTYEGNIQYESFKATTEAEDKLMALEPENLTHYILKKRTTSGKIMTHLFPSHHETLKRSEREGGKALEKVSDRVVAESLENSRTNRFVN